MTSFNSPKMVKKYDVKMKCWVVGYWVTNTRFKIVGTVRD